MNKEEFCCSSFKMLAEAGLYTPPGKFFTDGGSGEVINWGIEYITPDMEYYIGIYFCPHCGIKLPLLESEEKPPEFREAEYEA